eukprot:COSAG02_NODE_344_length_24146_cov_12.795983_2_plen_1040_part_00
MPFQNDVEFVAQPMPDLKPGTEVWVCRYTGEVFERYEDYIAAVSHYRQRAWTCEFTGKQSLTFEEALESELGATKWIEMFPQSHFLALLNRVQFNTKRIEELTTDVFDYFSEHYVEGQELDVLDGDDVKKVRIVREVVSGDASPAAGAGEDEDDDMDMSMTAHASTQYEVVWLDEPNRTDIIVEEEAIMKPEQKIPANKTLIKNAIRAVASKNNWGGSGPWLVRTSIADEYSIGKELPPTLKRQHDDWVNRAEIAKKAKRQAAAESAEQRKARERAERAQRLAEERQRKIEEAKYPMSDELLVAEGIQPPPLALPTSLSMNISTTGANFSRAVTVWSALNTFSRWWNLHPFTFEDFDQALNHGPCTLMSETFVCLLRIVLQQAQNDAERLASGRRKLAKSEDEGNAESQWTSDEWILEVEVSSLNPSRANWEDTLRQYLDLAAQQALTKRLEIVQKREYAKHARDQQPWLNFPVKWKKDDDPLSDKHYVVYDSAFAYPGDAEEQSSGEASETKQADGVSKPGSPTDGTSVSPPENQGVSSETPAGTDPCSAAGTAGEPSEAIADAATGDATGNTTADTADADTAGAKAAGGDDMAVDEEPTDDQPLYTATEMKALLTSIVQITREAHDGARSRAELFFDLPPKEHYPDYYEIVKNPISMRIIIENIEKGTYTNLESFRDDWMLLQQNAYLYNPDGSELRDDADFFIRVVQQKLAQFEALKKEESSGNGADGKTMMHMNSLRIPDLSGLARGALSGFQAPLETVLEVLAFLVDEALSSEASRTQLESTLEQADLVRKQLREMQLAIKQKKKEEQEKAKEEAERAETAAAAAAENGEEDEPQPLEPEAPPDPLTELRAANDALQMQPTEMMSRQELVLHNKELKASSERLRREEIALETTTKREQAAERKKQIDQKKKMNGFFTLLEELQVRGKALGFDRDHNQYWLLRPREPATADDNLLFVELNRGSITASNRFCQADGSLAGAFAANGNGNGVPLSDQWVQVVTEDELTKLIDSLEVKVSHRVACSVVLRARLPLLAS